MARRHWFAVGGYGLLITLSVLGALALARTRLGMAENRAVTVSFLTLAFAQLWHVFDMRDPGSDWMRNDITRNVYVWGALALCVGLLLAAVYLPILAGILKVVNPGANGWALVMGMSLIPLVIGQVLKQVGVNL
jgi:Ca2+-transporting ATPase